MHTLLNSQLVLQGEYVELLPLDVTHKDELVIAASDGELWNLNFTSVPSPESTATYIDEALKNRALGTQFPFVVKRVSDQKIVGCTRFYDIEASHSNLAIGYTWYSKSAQRTAVNTEAKLLLLGFAFEKLNSIAVAFHTDNLNFVSQTAIARLGATKEGVLRNHRVMPDGRIRHTWCFSIIDSEWPGIKIKLSQRLSRNNG